MKNILNWMKTNLFKNKKNIIISCCALAITTALTAITGNTFTSFANSETYFWGEKVSDDVNGNPNVTDIKYFYEYSPNLKGTVGGDTKIYVMDSGFDGPSLLVLGGTHPNEPSGQLTAALLLENIKPNKGKVFIITETNRSAFTHTYPQEGSPMYYSIDTYNELGEVTGTRTFKYGSRATNTNEQWPNPDIYVHAYYEQKLSTTETRNLNRAYPGLVDGSYTEQVAYAITNLIRQEDITITIDLHEASPEYMTINAIVAHERALAIAGDAAQVMNENELFGLEADKYLKAESSPTYLHGLTHRELGTHTNTLCFLAETSNASQGKYKGAFTDELILYRKGYEDKFYEAAKKLDDDSINGDTKAGALYGQPVSIEERVARHTDTIYQILNSYNCLLFELNYINDSEEMNNYFPGCSTMPEELYRTKEELIEIRRNQGIFDIDFGLLNDGNDMDAYASNPYDVIMDNEYGLGYFLHTQPSN